MVGGLDGIRVLDITQVMAGPFCGMLLADMGADVIKVEPPAGDSTRNAGRRGEPFLAVNRNKRGIAVNLKDPRGQALVRRLAARADVLVENYRPGVMAQFGLDYATLAAHNPGLVYCSISGFGQTGPHAHRGGFDLIAQGMSGLMSVTGEPGRPPVKVGVPITDLGAGLFASYAILTALLHRARTGEGQSIDTSLLEAGIALSVWEATAYWSTGQVPGPLGSAHRNSAPYQAFRTADGYINVGAQNEKLWEAFCHVLGRADLLGRPEYGGVRNRHANAAQLAALIEGELVRQPSAYWLERLEAAGIPAGPILNYAQVFSDPHVRHRAMVQEVDHPTAGRLPVLGHPAKLSRTPAAIRRPAPLLGQHTPEVLAEAGYTGAEIEELLAAGVVLHTAAPAE